MNVAALLQESPSEDPATRRARSGSNAGGSSTTGNNAGGSTTTGNSAGGSNTAGNSASWMDEEPEDREDPRFLAMAWGMMRNEERARGERRMRGIPSPPPTWTNAPDRDAWAASQRRERASSTSAPSSSSNAQLRSLVHSPIDARQESGYRSGPPPPTHASPSGSHMLHRGPPLSPIMSKDPKITTTSPGSGRLGATQGFGGPHGHPSHASPAMASLRPNPAANTGANSGHGGGDRKSVV